MGARISFVGNCVTRRKAEDGAALHVDHRLAVAKGGSNDEGNLWTLCDRCNLGKSDADL
jgi:5-methylcytosine-specific restriction endonuclease McrA